MMILRSMETLRSPVNATQVQSVNTESVLADAQEDSSLIEEELQQISPELESKINYVRTQ